MYCVELNKIEKRGRVRACGGPLPVIRITFVFSIQLIRTHGSFSPKSGSKM